MTLWDKFRQKHSRSQPLISHTLAELRGGHTGPCPPCLCVFLKPIGLCALDSSARQSRIRSWLPVLTLCVCVYVWRVPVLDSHTGQQPGQPCSPTQRWCTSAPTAQPLACFPCLRCSTKSEYWWFFFFFPSWFFVYKIYIVYVLKVTVWVIFYCQSRFYTAF
jgi:hypothetical protein